METALIAALVAAVVSLFGLLANLKIARDTRRSNILQLRLAAALKTKEEAVREIKDYTTHVERFRSACALLAMRFYFYDRTAPTSEHLPPDLQEKLEEAPLRDFEEQARAFFESWAEVKAHVPTPDILLARSLRHECKNQADTISNRLMQHEREILDHALPEEERKRIHESLVSLNQNLDRLFELVNRLRNGIITEVFLGNEHPASTATG